MKKLFMFLGLLIFLGFSMSHATLWSVTGEPASLTVTATSCAAGTWTRLLDSNLKAPGTAKLWRVMERTGSYKLKFTYNSLTWTVSNDYMTIPAGEQASYRLNIPNGVYVSPTWTAGAAITVEFESAY